MKFSIVKLVEVFVIYVLKYIHIYIYVYVALVARGIHRVSA